MIGEYLYNLTPRDSQQARIEFGGPNPLAKSGPVALFAFAINVPFDRVFIPRAFWVVGVPGGSQTGVYWDWEVQTVGSGATRARVRETLPNAAGVAFERSYVFNTDLVIGPLLDLQLIVSVAFNAATASNSAQVGCVGFTLPAGSLGGPGPVSLT